MRVAIAVLFFSGLLASNDAWAARRLEFEEEIIEGQVQKPEVQVYITRQNLNKSYDLELKESFLPKILDALTRSPF